VKRRIGTPFEVEIGRPIPFSEVAAHRERFELVAFLRDRTLQLAERQPRPR